MRAMLLTAAALCSAPAVADDPKPEKPKLKVGDPAPPFKPSEWLAGAEVKAFEKGKVYVVEFWTVWCGPCVAMMPHLGDLQAELGPKGVTVVGFTSAGQGNTREQVAAFLKKRGDKLGYAIAFGKDRETYDAFMTAAGEAGIPCSFVIGKDGRVAYIGHPMFLGEVMPRVLDGTWDPAKAAVELKAAEDLWDATYEAIHEPSADPVGQLAKWEAFSAKWPRLASEPYMTAARLRLLVAAKRFAEAGKVADAVVSRAAKRNDLTGLNNVADALSAGAAVGRAEVAAVAVRAAEAALAIDGASAASLTRMARAHAAAGDAARVKEFGARAVAAAEKELAGDKDASGTLRVADAYDAAGDKERARAAAERAVGMVDPKEVGVRKYIEEQARKYGAGAKDRKGDR